MRTKPLAATLATAAAFFLLSQSAWCEQPAANDADASNMQAQDAEQGNLAKDLSPTLKPIYDLGGDDEKHRHRIRVDAWVDKKNLTYEVGDTLTVSVSPRKNAYITILNVGSSGRVAV